MALEPTKHVSGRMWPPGQSGNPNGRPVGSRTVFSQGFLKDLAGVWAAVEAKRKGIESHMPAKRRHAQGWESQFFRMMQSPPAALIPLHKFAAFPADANGPTSARK